MNAPRVGERLTRAATLEGRNDNRLSFSFASEAPVARWFGNEVLLMSGADLAGLRSGNVPVLTDHQNRVDTIAGRVLDAWVDGGKARATVELADSERGRSVGALIDAGILRNVSVGYTIEQYAETADGYEATRWTPREISFVAAPADLSVGIGRSDSGGPGMDDQNGGGASGGPQGSGNVRHLDEAALRREATEAERDRVATLTAYGNIDTFRDVDGPALARRAIDGAHDLAWLRAQIVEAQREQYDREVASRERTRFPAILPAGRIGDDPSNFSIRRAVVQSIVASKPDFFKPSELREADWKGPESERTVDPEREGMGFRIPGDVLQDMRNLRTLNTGTTGGSTGGNLVQTEHLADSFIEMLRNMSAVVPYATVMSDLVGDVDIPRQKSAATAAWVNEESDALALTDQGLDQVSLSPKEVGAATQITRKLLIQGTPDAEMLIRTDIAEVIALAIDLAAINGGGGSAPTGILQTTGIGSVAAGTNGAAATWAHVVQLEAEVATDNAEMGTLRYITSPKVRGKLKSTLKVSSDAGAGFIWDYASPAAPLNGRPASISSQVPDNLSKANGRNLSAVMYGNFADLVVGFWSGLDIIVDPYSGVLNRRIRIVGYQDLDVAVRHAESFAAMVDVSTA